MLKYIFMVLTLCGLGFSTCGCSDTLSEEDLKQSEEDMQQELEEMEEQLPAEL